MNNDIFNKRILYIDCTAGISGDMVLNALTDLEYNHEGHHHHDDMPMREHDIHDDMNVRIDTDSHSTAYSHTHTHANTHTHTHANTHTHTHAHEHTHMHTHTHTHEHRSYNEVCDIIEHSPLASTAKALAHNIYLTIAKAEACVHEESLETVHFHEVGRDQAILNILSIAIAIDRLGIDEIYCSEIHDGSGYIKCSHGEIPVPVPAVMAIRESKEAQSLGLVYETDDIKTEMVTPSGLGVLVGLGARYDRNVKEQIENLLETENRNSKEMPKENCAHVTSNCSAMRVLSSGIGYGSRDIGKGGLKVHFAELSIHKMQN